MASESQSIDDSEGTAKNDKQTDSKMFEVAPVHNLAFKMVDIYGPIDEMEAKVNENIAVPTVACDTE